MKHIGYILLAALSMFAGTSQGQEISALSNYAVDPNINPFRLPILNNKKPMLDRSKLAIGTILKSHHFNDEDFNETHNGVYVRVDQWSVGTYKNSSNTKSVFLTYNPKIYTTQSLKVNLVAGVADGYEGWEYARNGYVPILGVSAQWMNLKAMLSYEVVAFGVELPLN